MRDRPTKFNDSPTIEDAWLDELERIGFDEEDFLTARCAELADELDLYRVQALADPNFQDSLYHWDCGIWEHNLWLALEQCCHEGVLLPMAMRSLRVQTAPKEMLQGLQYFFRECPKHVMHHLALMYWVVIRIDRARRTGNPDWRPETAPKRPPYHDTVFFRPPKLTFRNYAR